MQNLTQVTKSFVVDDRIKGRLRCHQTLQAYPLIPIITRQRQSETIQISVQQPDLIRNYNVYLGGLDLHDNAVSNYRTSRRSKKWWWSLCLSSLESFIVNAWKLNVLYIYIWHEHPKSGKA